jgi:hypothetical protein
MKLRQARIQSLLKGPPFARAFLLSPKGKPSMQQAPFSVRRDRLSPRLMELARLLGSPTPANIALVKGELERIGRG